MTTPNCARCIAWPSLCLGLSLIALAVPAAVNAKNDALAHAQALYDAFRYDEAYPVYHQALAVRGNTPEQIATIYLHLGIVAAAMDRPSEASEHFKRALCINPHAQLAEGVPPKVQGPFLVAQEAMKQLSPFRLGHSPPATRPVSGPLRLDVEFEPDALGLATGVAVRYREAGGAGYLTRTQAGRGRLTLDLPAAELRPGHDVEYYLQITESHGGVLWEYGSESSPIVVRVAAPQAPPVVASQGTTAAASGSGAVREDAGAPLPWYRQGWVWVVTGGASALLVAAGVTAAVALATNQPASSSVHFGSVSYRIAGD